MNESLLVNTLGHSAGVLIFGIFLFLLIQDRAARRLRGSTKSMLAAALALAWNLGSLLVLGASAPADTAIKVTVAISFSVLSLLPAVLFDLCLDRLQPWLVRTGYALSGVAITLHMLELFRDGVRFHSWGLTLITSGFGVLTGLAAARSLGRASASRLVGTMSLFLLAMSFVHLGGGHPQQAWSHELAFHHAAIPLALLVLMQDYRFVLLDAFLRFLANVLLAGLFVFAGVEAWQWNPPVGSSAPFRQALWLAGACLLLIVFAVLRGRVQALLTRLVFRRPGVEGLLQELKTPVRQEDEYIAGAARRLGTFMGAPSQAVSDPRFSSLELRRPEMVSELPRFRAELEAGGTEVVIPLRAPSREPRYILLGRRFGGRRYLSEDLLALGRAASVVVEQIEQYRESEMQQLVAQAELRALQSQIHPHFLFNALNALYGIIPREAKGARETVLNLADIFRYFLETRKMLLPLEEELRIVRAYLAVESLRLGDKLRIEVDVAPEALTIPIPVLSIQPLVENAVKHGIAPKPQGGLVRIEATVSDTGALSVSVEDNGAGFAKPGQGIGLENVNRRLELCYGQDAHLNVQSSGQGSTVSFRIPASVPQTVEALS